MRALDTNVLARFFIDDPDDEQAARQRPSAVNALSERAFVPVTLLLERHLSPYACTSSTRFSDGSFLMAFPLFCSASRIS